MAGSTTAPTAQQGDDAQHITTVREMAQDVRKCSWKEYGSGAGSQEEALLPPTSPTSTSMRRQGSNCTSPSSVPGHCLDHRKSSSPPSNPSNVASGSAGSRMVMVGVVS